MPPPGSVRRNADNCCPARRIHEPAHRLSRPVRCVPCRVRR
ncbi:hypothetical protein STRAU_3782 [Streptomyces aurantiacus JA 4570]|uniref:Uncharacterized protein n=1 Tax=Streptomyces aurantiacus JA 4570 TaxID=1286094 RepID=S3ZHT4_9ACTN|nr:hypothetical protein STRAU_3782 [Streptomyces aurantiacus JA 4570]